jgi:hypothetical protein
MCGWIGKYMGGWVHGQVGRWGREEARVHRQVV